MNTIEWTDALVLGIKKVDDQHRHLVGLTNTLIRAKAAGKVKDTMGMLLTDLYIYTVTHFNDEEELMGKADYQGLEEHRKKHKEFTDAVMQFKEQFENGDADIDDEIMTFLSDWLVDHIQGLDSKFASAVMTT
ncbi:MAG: hemerythrin family protein [candidate division Zixibacteria bacterium]|nr:hemerythrin family protein [candidate division Zixibacteria bacterium]